MNKEQVLAEEIKALRACLAEFEHWDPEKGNF